MKERELTVIRDKKEYLKFSSVMAEIGLERRTALRRAKKLGIKVCKIMGQGDTVYIERSQLEKFKKSLVVEKDLDKTKY